jgi:ankyrin repeat protein
MTARVALLVLLGGCASRVTLKGDAFYTPHGRCVEYPPGAAPEEPAGCELCEGQKPRSLHQAAQCLDLPSVRRFVERGADVNGLDRMQRAPLSLALTAHAVYWHPPNSTLGEVVRYLLDHGADPNRRFDYSSDAHYTLLAYAAFDGNLTLVRLLVEHGADVNLRDDRGYTAILLASYCDFRLSCDDCGAGGGPKAGALPTIKYLVEHGGDVAVRNKLGEGVLDVIHEHDCPKTRAYLEEQLRSKN